MCLELANMVFSNQFAQYRQNILSYISMTSFMVRQSHSFSHTTPLNNRKKIKHYSYSTYDKIGKGFSSIVYKGTNDNTNQIVAIKAIDMKGVKDAVSREMLDCEIQALTKLKHPNILKCYDVIRETSHCYIVTEFCNDGDLSSLLKKKRKLTENEVLAIMSDIVDGFLEIGENKYLHRDLKLANIFMSSGVAKIADFGFAKKSHSSFEKQRYNVGSPLYMSPQALKKNIYSTKNDIWSIGIMIYELLHGETPWQCRTESQLIDKMTRIPVKFKETLNISKQVKEFIRKCLEVDESKRMCLNGLRQWIKNNSRPRSLTEKVQQKKISPPSIQSEMRVLGQNNKIKPLGDATNRASSSNSNIQKNRSYSNVYAKYTNEIKSNNSFASKDKENNSRVQEKKRLSKTVIDKNNTILLVEINKFRLYYKIYEKLKNYGTDQKQALIALGNDILKKVETVANILIESDPAKAKKIGEELGMKELDPYLKQQTNPGIKKYKSVIKEYQKKYSSEISIVTQTYQNPLEALKRFSSPSKLMKQLSKDQSLMFYLIVEAVNLKSDVKKEELDSIIQAKNLPSKQVLLQRIKSF